MSWSVVREKGQIGVKNDQTKVIAFTDRRGLPYSVASAKRDASRYADLDNGASRPLFEKCGVCGRRTDADAILRCRCDGTA